MQVLNNSVMLGVPMCAPNFKFRPFPWDFVGSAVGGLFGSIGNIISTNNTNRANLEMQEKTNQANRDIAAAQNATNISIANAANRSNERMLSTQNQFNEMMWKKTNEYNSPLAQKQRLLAAGINPNIVLGQSPVATAETISSSPAAPAEVAQQVTPHMESTRFDAPDFSGLANVLPAALNSVFQSENIKEKREDVKEKQFNNEWRLFNQKLDVIKKNAEIDKMVHDGMLSKYNANVVKENLDRMVRKSSALDDRIDKENSKLDADTNSLNEDVARAKEQSARDDVRLKLESYFQQTQRINANANMVNAKANDRMSKANIAWSIEQCIALRTSTIDAHNESQLRQVGEKLDNYVKGATSRGIIKRDVLQTALMALDYEHLDRKVQSFFNKFLENTLGVSTTDITNALSGVAGAYVGAKAGR